MKNMYIQTIFGVIVAFISILPAMGYAAAPINIANNNYNTNVNTGTTVSGGGYQTAQYSNTHLQQIADNNLPTLSVTPTHCTSCGQVSYRMVQELNCSNTVAVANVGTYAKPSCSLIPSVTASGAIQLEWRTSGASVAFVDNGVGHVSTVSGTRIVTPTKDTAYNLTVLNDAGIASTCGAKIIVGTTNANTAYYNNTNQVASVGNVKGGSYGTQSTTYTDTQTTTEGTVYNNGTTVTGGGDTANVSDDTTDNQKTSIFSKVFKSVAIPIGIVFLVLILLLMFMTRKVKGAK